MASCNSACDNSCADICSGSSCAGTCEGSCSTCGSGCTSQCGKTCGTGCETACEATCNQSCQKQCIGKTQTSNLEKLILHQLFLYEDMQNIINFINYEVNTRRKLSQKLPNIERKNKITHQQISSLQNALKKANQKFNYTTEQKRKGLRELGNELIAKCKNCYNEPIV